MIKFDGPDKTALKTFWQLPSQKNHTTYVVNVMKAFKQYTVTYDVKLMYNSLKDIQKHGS